MQFISHCNKSQKYSIDENVVQKLQKKFADKNEIIVVVVCGNYRSGKSFLLNRLFGNKIFETSPTINSQTKGLYIANELIHEKYLLIDVEGLGACDVEEKHDLNLFVISLLISNKFIYNSVGPITSESMKKLEVANKLANTVVSSSSSSSSSTFGQQQKERRANLIWLCRDFDLQLVDRDNKSVTADEYFKKSINDQKDSGNFQETLQKLFSKTQLCTLPTPDNVKNLDLMRATFKLDEEFENSFKILENTIFDSSSSFSTGMNIDLFFSISNTIVNAINDGKVPVLEDVWTASSKLVKINAEKIAVEELRTSIKNMSVSKTFFNDCLQLVFPILHRMKSKFIDTDDNNDNEEIFKKLIEIVEEYSSVNDSRCQLAMVKGAQNLAEILATSANDGHDDDIDFIINYSELLDENCPFHKDDVTQFVNVYVAFFEKRLKNFAEFKSQYDIVMEENVAAKQAFHGVREEMAEMKIQISEQTKETAEMNEISCEKDAKITVMTQEIIEIKNTLDMRTEDFEDSEKKLKNDFKLLQMAALESKHAFEQSDKKLHLLESEHSHMKTNISDAVKQMRQKTESLQTHKKKDDEIIKKNTATIKTLTEKIASLDSVVLESKEVLSVCVKNNKENHDIQEKKMLEKKAEISQMSTAFEISKTKITHLDERLRHAQMKRKQMDENNDNNAELKWLKSQHIDDKKKIDEMQTSLAELRKEILQVRVAKLLF
jgi:hypothetical protein